MIPVHIQKMSADNLYALLKNIASQNGLTIYAVNSGMAISGSDLGSRSFEIIETPKIAMITGNGVSALDAGEVWHLLDQRFNIPSTHLEPAMFNRVNLAKYNTLIMVSGQYNELNKEKLKEWVQGGGTLILMEEAVKWAADAGVSQVKFKKTKSAIDSTEKAVYANLDQVTGAQRMSGAIFNAEVDLTHPLAYGYNSKNVSLFKGNSVFMELPKKATSSLCS